jgi:alkyl hydroperoxide reductase subunit AhpF
VVDARKTVLQGDAAWHLVAGADQIVVAAGEGAKAALAAYDWLLANPG